MKLNKLELKTTNNFNINDIELDINIPIYDDFKSYNISNNEYVKVNNINNKLANKIGLEFDKYYEINIVIPKDIKLSDPIVFSYIFENSDVLVEKFNIVFEENSKADIIIKHVSLDNGKHFHNLNVDIKSNKYSNGTVTYINNLNENSYNFLAIENDVYSHSNIKQNIIDIGGNIRLYNVYTNTYEYATNDLNTIYMGNDKNIIDINYYLNNIGIKSDNKINVQGVLDKDSKKNFRGTLDFKKGCSKSIGEEIENCILLTDTCVSRSLPMMLCTEEDVSGSHGVSSGKIDNSKLFYLMTRGLSKKEAEKFIVKTNFNTILKEIPDNLLQEELDSIIDSKIK